MSDASRVETLRGVNIATLRPPTVKHLTVAEYASSEK